MSTSCRNCITTPLGCWVNVDFRKRVVETLCDIYTGKAPSHNSGGGVTLGVLILAGQRNRLDVVTEVNWIFQLLGESNLSLRFYYFFQID
jgi:hypothetical protein